LVLAVGLLSATSVALGGPSPWWEHYESKQTFRCGDSSELLLERNDSQASVYHRGYKTNLFRDLKAFALHRYANERLSVVLNGDELIIEDLLSKTRCHRTEQV
jgi:hypothetical protein